jgi:hypothetical protein
LRQSIPIRGEWTEEGPGWLEIDTVALCGGSLDDRHTWMVDSVDICTDWTELRASENRSQHCVLKQVQDIEESLPFELLGVDSDNGGEFLNHHLVRYFQLRPKPVFLTRARPYRKNDNAHVEQPLPRGSLGRLSSADLLRSYLPVEPPFQRMRHQI